MWSELKHIKLKRDTADDILILSASYQGLIDAISTGDKVQCKIMLLGLKLLNVSRDMRAAKGFNQIR